jgi:hypothetical protein
MEIEIELNRKIGNRKAQLTLFVIIALLIVGGIILFFIIRNQGTIKVDVNNPEKYISECIAKSLEANEKIVLENNGYLNKTDNYIIYSNEKVPYLCKSSQFYLPCINQEPMFLEIMRKQIQENVKKDATKCFENLVATLKRKYEIKDGAMTLVIVIEKGKLKAEIDKKIEITSDNEKRNFENFESEINSPIYGLGSLAQTIVNFESTLCEFNSVNWMANYPDIKISKFMTGEGTRVYTLEDRETQKNIGFAVKTCVMPAGI